MAKRQTAIMWFEEIGADDVSRVGGKNASLGEMIRTLQDEGVRVPNGFATTADAYRTFLDVNDLSERIRAHLDDLKNDGERSLEKVGNAIRRLFRRAEFPQEIAAEIRQAYYDLSRRYDTDEVDVAVRSSATAEDLPEASFAGQQETFLNVSGEDDLLDACRRCYASLFTNRAIVYRQQNGFDHMQVALSIGVQKMVRADGAGAGVMFSIDTDTGFPHVVLINAAWGLGENIVQGAVNPDQYTVFKPLLQHESLMPIVDKKLGEKEKKLIYASGGSATTRNINTTRRERQSYVLSDNEIVQLARWACTIEQHYGKPMDMEWAKDGDTGDLFIVQARPETVQSRTDTRSMKTCTLTETGKRLLRGLSIGTAITAGKVCVLKSPEDSNEFEDDAILVTEMTDPDWGPIMQRARGIITDHGGRTSHAAIVSRELGVPAIVGAGDATTVLHTNQEITLSCAEGDEGYVYDGVLAYDEVDIDLQDIPKTKTRMMMNIASPTAAFRWWRLPCEGVGLARMEFIINDIIKIHPMALVAFDQVTDAQARNS